MSRLFLGNFDFEYELAAAQGRRAVVPAAVQAMQSSLAAAWIGAAEGDDFILCPRTLTAGDFPDLQAAGVALPRFVTSLARVPAAGDIELVPWGWTPAVLASADKNWSVAAPPLDLVRLANSRAFRLQLEQELGIAPAGAAAVRSLTELHEALSRMADLPRGWILKANFGMAGRESLRGRGALSESAARWAARRLERTGALVVEPRLELVAEAGVQVDIPRQGEPLLAGVAEQIVDARGAYRGSRFDTGGLARPERREGRGSSEGDGGSAVAHAAMFRDARHALPASGRQGVPPSRSPGDGSSGSATRTTCPWQSAVDVALCVAERLQGLGYFGPLGIDAALYGDESGAVLCRPLQDLNARWTLGRLALGFRRLLPEGWCGTWLWLPAGRDSNDSRRFAADMAGSEAIRAVRTSPASAGAGEPRGVLVLAADADSRAQAEKILVGQ